MKLNRDELDLVSKLHKAGGSICPGRDATITADAHRLLRKLERRGVVSVEATDDGGRFELTSIGWAEAVNG